MPSKEPIRLALIGAGIFARDAHVPALKALKDAFKIVAVCSRSQTSAASLAAQLEGPVDVYTDVAALLARRDVEAVDILLPIDTMPGVVEMALKAGKHVISEKPVSPDVATGRRLLAAHAGQVWMVAENFRYEDALVQATEVVQSGKIGRPLLFHWNFCIAMTPAANKYYHTDWRRSGEFPGGFILDGGVHNVAAFRMALGEVSKVNAVVVQIRSDLPPADTLSAILQFDSGVVGNWSVTYAGGAPWASPLHIAGENGIVRVDTGSLEITVQGKTHSSKFASNGVEAELAAFAAAIREGKPHRNTPAQALQDVAVIEALLKAAETGCSVNPERIV